MLFIMRLISVFAGSEPWTPKATPCQRRTAVWTLQAYRASIIPAAVCADDMEFEREFVRFRNFPW